MRHDPARLTFEIHARDGDARRGTSDTPRPGRNAGLHPLAQGTRFAACPRGKSREWVTRWCWATPTTCWSSGPERIAEAGGLHRFMGWRRRSSPTGRLPGLLAGPRQGWPRRSDQVLGRRCTGSPKPWGSVRDGSAIPFLWATAPELMLSPEESMRVQAALASDIAPGLR